MPISTVIKFNTVNNKDIDQNLTKQFHGLLFRWFSEIDTILASAIHNENIKPFTISPVMSENDYFWVKISFLIDKLADIMINFFENDLKKQYQLGKYKIVIDEIIYSSDSNCWACKDEYADLISMPISYKVNFEFLTPTAFKQGDYLLPMPIPTLIFKSILTKWNYFSPYKIIEFDDIESSVIISQFNIRTEEIKFSNFRNIGFIGIVSFNILKQTNLNLVKSLNILSNFIIYSGIGYKNTMGMGICRRIINEF